MPTLSPLIHLIHKAFQLARFQNEWRSIADGLARGSAAFLNRGENRLIRGTNTGILTRDSNVRYF